MSCLPLLCERIGARLPMQRSFIERAVGALHDDERVELERLLSHELDSGLSIELMAESYALIVEDTLREQIFFRRHKRYRYQRFEDVAGAVYFEPGYMRRYMLGLAVTAFLWPNHAEIRRYFESVIRRFGRADGRYLEVGPGHGFFIASAVAARAAKSFEAVDISPTSLDLTRSLLARTVPHAAPDVRLRQGDFLQDVTEPVDLLVMGEVLEHVEAPALFLERARANLRPGGIVFLTTCANSPATDHIFLFRNAQEVVALVEAAGLRVLERLVLPYAGTTLEQSEREGLPINLALVATP